MEQAIRMEFLRLRIPSGIWPLLRDQWNFFVIPLPGNPLPAVQDLEASVAELPLRIRNGSWIIPHFRGLGIEREWIEGSVAENEIGMKLDVFCREWGGNGMSSVLMGAVSIFLQSLRDDGEIR